MNSYTIELQQKVRVMGSIATAVRSIVIVTLRHQEVPPPASLTLLLTDDEYLRHLNKTYRGIDEPTDVLSFAADPLPEELEVKEPRYLGDIAISVPTAKKQARAGRHSLKAELQLLTVHGTLHLLGFDHEEPEEKKLMWYIQNSILAQVGAEITSPE